MCKQFLFSIAIICLATTAPAQKKHYQLSVPSFACYKTTEDGADEVYLLLTWKTTTGREGNFSKGIWSMNDTRHQENDSPLGTIVDLYLDPGEIVEILGTVMEQDDGQPRQYEAVGRSILQDIRGSGEAIFPYLKNGPAELANKIKNLLAVTAQANRLKNSDDWIGSFSFRVPDVKQNQQPWDCRGIFNTNDAAANTNRYYIDATTAARLAVFNFGGDGSKYTMKIMVRQLDR